MIKPRIPDEALQAVALAAGILDVHKHGKAVIEADFLHLRVILLVSTHS